MSRLPNIAIVLLAATVAVLAQQPPLPQAPPVFRGSAELVEVDVVVRDKKGAFVSDLSADDFVVEEGGKAQPIQQFYLRLTSSSGLTVNTASASVGQDGPAAPPATNRIFVVVFDDTHMTLAGFKRAQSAAQSLFSKQFRTGDIGGVVVRGRMANGRLTSERDELLKAVKDARPDTTKSSRQFDERQFPRLTEIEAVRIAFNNDRVVLEEAVRRACADDEDLCKRIDPEPAVRSKAMQLSDEARAGSNATADTIRTLAKGLAAVPGRKTIVLMSEGFIAEESWPLVSDAVAEAARANARIYTLDARALDRNLGSLVETVRTSGLDSNADTSARLLDQMDFGGDAMNSLAVDTGGFVVRNTNQFDKAIERIGEDAGNYYVLGYQPAGGADGKFHRITVRVKRPAVAVRARRGYVATPRPAPATTEAPTTAERTASPAAAAAEAERPASIEPPAPVAAESIADLDPSLIAATVVSSPGNARGFRVRPDAEPHARVLEAAASAAPDPDAVAGWDAYQRGDVETARSRLSVAAERPAANAWVHYTLGMSSYALRQFRDASASWERVRAEAPDFEPVYFDLVDAYLQQKDHEHAIRIARAASERWPRDPEIANALGVAQTARGALDDAVKAFQSAIGIAPQDPTGYFNLGKALELRYMRTRRYVQQLRRWIANENDRSAAVDAYQHYVDLGGVYADAARAGLDRLKWLPK